MKAAFIVPPATIASGGGKILSIIGEVLEETHRVDYIFLLPESPFGFPNGYVKTLKSIVKISRSLLTSRMRSKKILALRATALKGYDVYLAGWVGDLAQLLRGGISPDRVVHICQSIETWAGSETDSSLAYGVALNRLFVADWLRDYLRTVTLNSYIIGNAIGDEFFEIPRLSGSGQRRYVTYLTHPGWWKNVTETSIAARMIAERTGLSIQTFGSFAGARADRSVLRPNSRGVINCLDQSRIFISLSLYEGMPLVVLEAIARQCFVILSDIPAHREICSRLGESCGILVKTPPFHFGEYINILRYIEDCMERPLQAESLDYYCIKKFKKRVRTGIRAVVGD